jgi:hypothetical protein
MPLSDEKSIRTLEILAPTIKDHRQFESKLASAPPELRRIIYETCRPYLSFEAKPLDWYIMKSCQRAEQEQLPLTDGGSVVRDFQPAQDASTIRRANEVLAQTIAKRTLTLTCGNCLLEHQFYALDGETPNATIRRARECGWVYDYKADPVRELCPECAK